MAILEAKNITKHFAGLTALEGVNLRVEEGIIHSIIGPNGAGKSTLIDILTGRQPPDYGTVSFAGQSLEGLEPHTINQLGIARVFQTPELYPDMTALENVTVAALASRDGSFRMNFVQHPSRLSDVRDEAVAVLEEVGLHRLQDREARHLSRGDKRRLELAICLAHKPRLLLLDEPTAGMSHHETHSTTELLRGISKNGMTKVIIEHDMDVVFALSQRITVLHQGRVIADGTPEEIRNDDGVQEAYLGGEQL